MSLNLTKTKGVQIAAVFITLAVVSLLVATGPAQALQLRIYDLSPKYDSGEDIEFTASIKIQNKELVNLQEIELLIDEDTVCTIDIQGNKLSECNGIDIQKEGDALYSYRYGRVEFVQDGKSDGQYRANDYGYGYGYGSEEGMAVLSYKVKISGSREDLTSGEHEFQFRAVTPERNFVSNTDSVRIGENKPEKSDKGKSDEKAEKVVGKK